MFVKLIVFEKVCRTKNHYSHNLTLNQILMATTGELNLKLLLGFRLLLVRFPVEGIYYRDQGVPLIESSS